MSMMLICYHVFYCAYELRSACSWWNYYSFKDKYRFVLNIVFCMPMMLICYHVFCCAYELLLMSLMMYISSNLVLTLYCLQQSVN
jgi:hypothetical protein